jgi:RNA polymerase sigma-70 factor (sigma-E family)
MAEVHGDFDEFVRGRADALLRLAFLLVGDRQLAEDHLQDVFERMFLRWSSIRDSPDGYARRALVNRAVNHWRWRRRHQETPLSADVEPSSPDHAGAISSRHAVVRALAVLSRSQRAAIVLRHLDGLSVAEVANILGCSEGAVKTHTFRGLAKLRELIPPSALATNGDHHD